MGTTAEKILALARKELGTTEFPPGSNKVKYNTAYYGKEVSGSAYPWCCAFIWWLFQQAGAPELFYGGKKTAYCPSLMTYHAGQGQGVTAPYKPGDIIFFNFNGKKSAGHVGICEVWDGTYITTIDGNTGTGNEANGGAVMRRRRHKKYIVGACRPRYEGGIDMSKDEVRALVREEISGYLDELGRREPEAHWQKEQLARVKELGITDGSRPLGLSTRLETAIMAANARKTC